MSRTKLTMNDVAGDLLKGYEAKYQAILKKYKENNKAAEQYKEEIAKQKLSENRNWAIKEAGNLKSTLNQELINLLNKKSTEYTVLEAAKEQNPENIKSVFNGSNNMSALQLIYDGLEKNSRLLTVNSLLNTGHIPAIERFLDDNSEHEDVRNIVEAYVNSQPDKFKDNHTVMAKIQDAKTTPVDDVNQLIGTARVWAANSDIIPSGDLFNHSINNDFNENARAEYFK